MINVSQKAPGGSSEEVNFHGGFYESVEAFHGKDLRGPGFLQAYYVNIIKEFKQGMAMPRKAGHIPREY